MLRFFTVLAAVALLLCACGGAGARPGYTATQQASDGVTITLERPSSVTLLQDYEFFVTLSDAGGQPIDGATVFLEQDMPAMPMGTNQPLGEPLGKGQYRIKGVFTMDGQWIVKIHASIAGKEHVATFEQSVAPVK
ncbi:MAG TPA: FixH family protein [Kouleothrix sp.]|uniref:FixH family protein n=1 Tax=Kouleothrix sp. TaxID=2779161 RepID=UPI002BC66324|nr:FixH family protein [Kouleothrix sp.]HRC74623.1 FixH family protein [Kouleothrix sp.]